MRESNYATSEEIAHNLMKATWQKEKLGSRIFHIAGMWLLLGKMCAKHVNKHGRLEVASMRYGHEKPDKQKRIVEGKQSFQCGNEWE